MDKMSICKGVLSIAGGLTAFLFGEFDALLITLTALVVLDFISGLLEAVIHGKLSSAVGFKGIAKKVFIFLLVATAHLIQGVTGNILPIRETIITFFIANEALSILENATRLGMPFTEELKEILLQLKDSKEIKEIKKIEFIEKQIICKEEEETDD